MAKYLISKKDDIKRIFNYTLGADEIFLQTVAMESPFYKTIVDDSLREIDWKRGEPYTYRIDDYDMLMKSSKIFARKFCSEIDDKIIEKIYKNVTNASAS